MPDLWQNMLHFGKADQCYIIFFSSEQDIAERTLRLKEYTKIRLEIFSLLHEYVLRVKYVIHYK